MRILVAFKVIPDYEALRDADWARAATDGAETGYVRRVLNCFDESALELALRFAEAIPQEEAPGKAEDASAGVVSLEALTIGDRRTEPFLRTLLALGYERAARVERPAALDFAPGLTASIIAECTRRAGADLLLLGCESGPADSGVVPFLVAERLGWPCLTRMTAFEHASGALRVTWDAGDAPLRATLLPPAVLAVGNAVVSRLRVPTLSDRLATRDRPIRVLPAVDIGVRRAGARPSALLGLEPVDRSRAGVVVPGETARDKARALLEGHIIAGLLEMS